MPFGARAAGAGADGLGHRRRRSGSRSTSRRLPGNVWATPRLPPRGLVLIALGGLWLCLWRGKWRRWGSVAIAVGFAEMMLTRPPDVVIAEVGRFVAARAPDGHYFASADGSERDRALVVRLRDRRRSGRGPPPGRRRKAGSTAARSCAAIRRAAAPSRSSPAEAALPLKCDRGRRDRQPGAGRLSLPLE